MLLGPVAKTKVDELKHSLKKKVFIMPKSREKDKLCKMNL